MVARAALDAAELLARLSGFGWLHELRLHFKYVDIFDRDRVC